MKRRKFLQNSVLATLAGVFSVSTTNANNNINIEEFKNRNFQAVNYSKKHQFRVIIQNIHTDYFKEDNWKNFEINSDSLFTFSFAQGDFGIVLVPMSHGAVQSFLYQRFEDEYELVGKNMGNAEKSDISWLESGVKVSITNISKHAD